MSDNKVFSKFRTLLPSDVSDEIITEIIKWCYERMKDREIEEELLLNPNTRITYGSAHHMLFTDELKPYINIYQIGTFGINWVFDLETGKNIAT